MVLPSSISLSTFSHWLILRLNSLHRMSMIFINFILSVQNTSVIITRKNALGYTLRQICCIMLVKNERMLPMDLLQSRMEVLAFLDQRAIPYEYHEHERAHTIEDCLKMPFITSDVTICRNILLCNRQQTAHYLLLLRPLTPFRTSIVSKLLGSKPFGPVNLV